MFIQMRSEREAISSTTDDEHATCLIHHVTVIMQHQWLFRITRLEKKSEKFRCIWKLSESKKFRCICKLSESKVIGQWPM